MTLKNRLSGTAAVLALLPVFAAVPALAQSAPQSETIEVTGSRIKTTNGTSPSPITVVTSEEIAQTKATTVEDVLLKLPSVNAGVTQNDNNGGGGVSNVSLRNLSANRTLVLVNGQRFVGTGLGAVDLNNIPVSMIDRIDVLKDGASSIYGADAVAGVINIVLKQHMSGVQFDTNVGITDKGDGTTYGVSSTLGADFDRGNIIINASTQHEDPISGNARAWNTNQHFNVSPSGVNTSSRLPGLVDLNTGEYYYGTAGQHHTLTDGAFWAANPQPDTLVTPGGTLRFDLSQEPYIKIGLERESANFTSHYDLVPNVTAVLEAFYTHRQSQAQLNPEPFGPDITTQKYSNGFIIPAMYSFYNAAGVLTTAANPFNPDGADIPAFSRRFEGGDRQYRDDSDTFRVRAGLEGTLWSKYDWSVGYVYGQSQETQRVYGEVNFTHLSQLTGQTPCGINDAIYGCSLANFAGTGTLTPAQVKYISFTDTLTDQTQESYAYGSIGGPIYQLPAGPIQFAAGFEQRSESGFSNPDATKVAGDADADASTTKGGYQVSSLYAELNVPLLSNLPFVKALSLNASSRYDLYTNFGQAVTYKFGVEYAITDDIAFRGNRSTNFRAPALAELYTGQFQNAPTADDPCDSHLTGGESFAGSTSCVASLSAAGLRTAAQQAAYTQALPQGTQQITTVNGGNPNLKPENATQFNVGLVGTPHWVPGMTASVDYYNVHIRNLVTAFATSDILNSCYDPAIQNSTACSLINPRQAGTGFITGVRAINTNFGFENTDGIELAVAVPFQPAKLGVPAVPGVVTVTGEANYLLHDTTESISGAKVENAGYFGGNSASASLNAPDFGEPRWRANLGTTYAPDDTMSFDFTERYIGGIQSISNLSADLGSHTAGIFYSDLSGTYRYHNVTLTLGVDNLFDKDPPYVAGGLSSTSLGDTGYDFTGRFVYMKASVKF